MSIVRTDTCSGEWNPTGPYTVIRAWGIPGFSFTIWTRNAGFRIIAYETDLNPEILTLKFELAYQLAKATLAIVAEGLEAEEDWADATLTDVAGGFAF